MGVRRVGLMRRWRCWRGWWSVAAVMAVKAGWRLRQRRQGAAARASGQLRVSRWRRGGGGGVEVAAPESGVLRW
ncbi:hypothetical protein EDB84DRAFT_1534585 [Lactarius hengduanensis]|nr:hypothetical protein EDB84DRAFT_1534944 [Lactarius hengduanensis]KAH9012872.1 hypothetical protein EDB84DRAFT_1534585 [Lactarius hengduanensis]